MLRGYVFGDTTAQAGEGLVLDREERALYACRIPEGRRLVQADQHEMRGDQAPALWLRDRADLLVFRVGGQCRASRRAGARIA